MAKVIELRVKLSKLQLKALKETGGCETDAQILTCFKEIIQEFIMDTVESNKFESRWEKQ